MLIKCSNSWGMGKELLLTFSSLAKPTFPDFQLEFQENGVVLAISKNGTIGCFRMTGLQAAQLELGGSRGESKGGRRAKMSALSRFPTILFIWYFTPLATVRNPKNQVSSSFDVSHHLPLFQCWYACPHPLIFYLRFYFWNFASGFCSFCVIKSSLASIVL